jgi:PAS domain S-box-containing protein
MERAGPDVRKAGLQCADEEQAATAWDSDPPRVLKDQPPFPRHRKTLIEFGALVLEGEDFQNILYMACKLVAEALHSSAVRIKRAEKGREETEASFLREPRLGIDPEHAGETPSGSAIIDKVASLDSGAEVEAGEAGSIGSIRVPILLPDRTLYGLIEVEDVPLVIFRPRDIVFLRVCALILGVTIDRWRRLRELAETGERFRVIIENARDYAIILSDKDDIITEWLSGATAIFGWEPHEIVGEPAATLFLPEDRENRLPEIELETAQREGAANDMRWRRRKDGNRICIDGRTIPLRNPDGDICGYMRIGQDVTDRKRDEEQLRENEERFRQFATASTGMIWIRDARTFGLEYANPAYVGLFGDRLDQFRGWLKSVVPVDRRRALVALRRVRRGERVTHQFRARRAHDGAVRLIRNTDFPLLDTHRKVQRIGGIGRDVTEEAANASRMEVLVAELQHRTRNLMAVVEATAEATLRSSSTLDDFKARFRDRLAALARVQGLLSRLDDGARITFDELMHAELKGVGAPEDPSRVTLSGPGKVLLRSSGVQTLAMALHELATNAVKYGALGQEQAHLSITWSFDPNGENGRPWLHIRWDERGVRMPTGRAESSGGQGRKLIEQALPYQLGARTSFELGPDGLHCTISIPVSQRSMADGCDA